MWSSLLFIALVIGGSFVAWQWCKRRCTWSDEEETEANAMTPPPAPRIPRRR